MPRKTKPAKDAKKIAVKVKKKPIGKRRLGRPSKFTPTLEGEIIHEAMYGFTDKELCKRFGIDEKTLNNWKKQFPLFFQSLKEAKAQADRKVERSLYERACGYSHPDVKVFHSAMTGETKTVPIIKHVPPDTTAIIYWLKNRQPEKWRDRQEIDLGVKENLLEKFKEYSKDDVVDELIKAITG